MINTLTFPSGTTQKFDFIFEDNSIDIATATIKFYLANYGSNTAIITKSKGNGITLAKNTINVMLNPDDTKKLFFTFPSSYKYTSLRRKYTIEI